jgi:hypothetical protein
MIGWLIIAQGARIGVIWVSGRTARKVLKTVALLSVMMYLAKRHERQKLIDEKRGYTPTN